ncbi:MAG: hypothetical protein AN485_23600, partial [Anabaena sp. MDT14b]
TRPIPGSSATSSCAETARGPAAPHIVPRPDFPDAGRMAQRPAGPRAVSAHEDVAELPGIGRVDVLGEQAGAILERVPVGVIALHRPKIRQLHFEAAAVIHLIRLDDAG